MFQTFKQSGPNKNNSSGISGTQNPPGAAKQSKSLFSEKYNPRKQELTLKQVSSQDFQPKGLNMGMGKNGTDPDEVEEIKEMNEKERASK